jgi:adenylate kinase
MKYVVIFGPPGSGKGTQSDKIIEKYGFAHISTGDVLRGEISANTELGVKANEFIKNGQLVPDDLIVDMLAVTLDNTQSSTGVIFDGFPRTTPQAVALQAMLKKRDGDVNTMLSLEVEREELIQRLLKRGKTSGRADDNLETIEKRIAVYNEQTTPVIEFYKAEGSHSPINGIGSIDDIFGRIVEALG